MSVVITGASDDLIEIDGDVREEFQYQEGRDNFVALSNGTVLRIEYARSGVWRIATVADGDGFVTLTQAPEDDDSNYSDRAELTGSSEPITWAVHGIQYAKAKG